MTQGANKMTIYVIRGNLFGDIWEVTSRTPSSVWYESDGCHVEEHPDATADELARVADLETWLLDNYNAGAHWIVETTDSARHVIELREQTPGQYRVALERHWRTMDDVCHDVRAAGGEY
jgi:hypothetical protein